jgi:uncharacterized protein (TIGR03435 family)
VKQIYLGIFALAVGAFAQALTFEVASVKLTPPPLDGRISISINGDAGRIDWQGVPLKFMIARAYEVQDFQVSGPDWLATQRFEVIAKLPQGATEKQIPEMLRALLAERFTLTVHKESKEMQIDTLTVAKGGLKVKPVESDAGQVRVNPGRIQLHGAPMSQLSALLARMLDRPVLDQTGAAGNYDLRFEFTPEGAAPSSDNPKPSLFTALQEQAGLKLESKKAPVELVVVDRVEKLPTEN